MKYTKAENRSFALKLLLMVALDIHQDIRLSKYEGGDRISYKKILAIIKLLQSEYGGQL
jgi:hypothetical protein